MAEWDTIILKEFKDLREDEEDVTIIRELTPGRNKYRSTYARIKVSKNPDKYPERLWVRLGKGQLVDTPCSVQIMEFLSVIPEGM
jgi:hypothetical protein